MMDAVTPAEEAVRAQADAYGEAVYFRPRRGLRGDVPRALPDDADRRERRDLLGQGGLSGARARPFGVSREAASYEILSIDVAGDEIARVHLWVDVPPVRYEDHLGFVKVDGQWKLLTKVFRTMGPAVEG
jgi:hypothetical protein